MLARFWREVDTVGAVRRLRLRAAHGLLSASSASACACACCRSRRTRATSASCSPLLFPRDRDAQWLDGIDDDTLARLVEALGPMLGPSKEQGDGWRRPLADAHHLPRQRGARAGLLGRAAPAHEPGAAGRRPVPPARQRRRAAARTCRRRRHHRAAAGGAVPARAARRLPALRRQRARPPRSSTACRWTWCSRSTSCASALRPHRGSCSTALLAPQPAREAAAPAGRPGAARPSERRSMRAPVRAPLLAAGAQGGRAQRRNRRALHHPRPRRIPRHAARARPAAAR